ncbi:response regulator transcription factor [Actinoplanes rectilineatus]|uniref:response regulator transcription factor n=1 Tax=Actinoplanes rectilineatus TaxID=113571 RepID=UPI0005F2E2C4|nr:response regulator transcription factor [Actinoplanes rectilineatus]
MPASGTPVTVFVHDADPLINAGLTHLLRCSARIEVRDPGPGDDPAGVAVLFTDRMHRPVLNHLRDLARSQRLVLVVAHLTEHQLLQALDAGVSAILFRHEITGERLLDAVGAAARDERDLPREAVGRLVDVVTRLRRQPAAVRDAARPPTERELAVLRLLADGLETRDIAERLAVSERTVKKVLHGVTVRFRLRNRTHAVAHALREGYL